MEPLSKCKKYLKIIHCSFFTKDQENNQSKNRKGNYTVSLYTFSKKKKRGGEQKLKSETVLCIGQVTPHKNLCKEQSLKYLVIRSFRL